MISRLVLGLSLLSLYVDVAATLPVMAERMITVVNETDLHFDLQPRAFDGSDFSSFPYTLSAKQSMETILASHDHVSSANGLILFSLSSGYVFSLILKEAAVTMHGCKSKRVFFHPDEYICRLTQSDTGEIRLLIQRPSQ